ncbi:MAG: MFS transporter [Sphingomonadales bacterium]|nr:MFS transporter [Sphingomonadaceae bacterium]MBS3931203.1 MFS transporter [Sphingomonadales bacterium]
MTRISPGRSWALFAVLCAAGIFNAMDRPIIAILKPDMSADFGWTDKDFGDLGFYTQVAAAVSFLFTGWLVDRLGVRKSMIGGVTAWSLAAMAHGWAVTTAHVVAARVGLGATEAVQTPLTIKTVATLFEPNQRSFAFGVGTAIASLGTIALPFFIPLLAAMFGWRGALIFGGVAGFIALAVWLALAWGIKFDDSAEDETLDYNDDAAPYGPILREKRTWAICVAKAISDATWWFIGFWLADFYRKQFGLTTQELAVPLALAFTGSALGALYAGWISTRLLERGWSVNRVRKTVMLVSALVVVPLPLVLTLNSFWPVAIMMGLVMAGHQGFSLSIFATITDVVPRAKVGRVTAFGAFMGNMGGAGIVKLTGILLVGGYGYTPLFLFAAVSYLIALAWLHLLLPEIRRPELSPAPARFVT